MPGLFSPHRSQEHAGWRPNLFEPAPRFADGSEMTGRQVTHSAHETRKRNRDRDRTRTRTRTRTHTHTDHTLDPQSSTPYASSASPWAHSLENSRSSAARSPPPLANDQYELAGGMDHSAGGPSKHYGDYDDYFNLEKQRRTWSSPTTPYNGPGLQQQLGVTGAQSTSNGTKPWVLNQILSVVGGVAGTLVRFCAVPFRGFQSGGGQAYTFNANGEVAAKLFTNEPAGPVQSTLPGLFIEEDYGVRAIDSAESERPRMAKRARTGDSWVVVDRDGSIDSRPSTPRLTERRVPAHTISPSQIPRPVSRAGAHTPSHNRPSLIPVSRRTTFEKMSLHGASRPASPAHSHARSYSRDSYGSPVMFENKSPKKKSPLPPESQRLINKVRRENFEDNARMRRMSTQMSAMLQEAREALGSKFEVDEYMDDDESGDEEIYPSQKQMYPW